MSNADAYKKLLKNRKEAFDSAGSEPMPEPTADLPTPIPKPPTQPLPQSHLQNPKGEADLPQANAVTMLGSGERST
jgi:hypothetical protein